MFGFDFLENFNYPYISKNIREFWRRWHISLSTWFRDYVYIPLGGSRGGKWMQVRNTFIIFIVSGFWHGANWTFIVWGALNAMYFLPLLLMKQNRKNLGVVAEGRLLPSLRELLGMSITFFLAVLAWIFFRAENIQHAFIYLKKLIVGMGPSINGAAFLPGIEPPLLFSLLFIFIICEWMMRATVHGGNIYLLIKNRWLRTLMYCVTLSCILWFSQQEQEFIYFQF